MSVEEAIETLEKMIKCAELDQHDCFSRECVHCEYHTEPEEQIAAYKAALLALKDNNTPDMTKTVNNAIRDVINYLCVEGELKGYNFRSYLSGVSKLADCILNKK